MTMAVWDPTRDMDTLRRDIDQAFAEAGVGPMARRWRGAFLPGRAPRMYPLVNVYDKGDAFTIEALAPGVDPSRIDVTVVRNTLTITGEKTNPLECSAERLHRSERATGRFVRSMDLPADIDRDRINAEYRAGVLLLNVPLAETARPRRIEVQAH